MAWAISDSRGLNRALRESSPEEPKPRLYDFIENGGPLSREKRLDIYAEGYFARVLSSLSGDFKTLERFIGEAAFAKLISEYLDEYPSRFTHIGEVGIHLAHFIAGHDFGRKLPMLADLAELEWATIESFYSSDVPPLSEKRLAEIPTDAWPQVRLRLSPSVRLLKPGYGVHVLWRERDSETFPPELTRAETPLLVRRERYDVQVEELSLPAWEMLRCLKAGEPLGAICEAMQGEFEALASPPPLLQWFSAWVKTGVIFEIGY